MINDLLWDNKKNQNGEIVYLEEESVDIEEELLENSSPQKQGSFSKSDNTYYITMDATQILEDYGIQAKDLTKEKANQKIKNWIAQCDRKQGTYLLKSHSAKEYTTFIYYNGGGRYPWNISMDKTDININLYSDHDLVTEDGYYLYIFYLAKGLYRHQFISGW